MILAISGLHGTGKSSVGRRLAEELNIDFYSIGQAFRDLAREKGFSLEEFTSYVEKHPEIDNELDDRIINLAKKGNIIIDSQLSGFLLKNIADFRILLTAPIETRVKRMTLRDESSIEEKIKETKFREKSELERFKKLYNIDIGNNDTIKNIFNIIINTENLSIEQVVKKVLNIIKN
ncbi:MAG: (d)CMP kinase [Promethearchaeota archaeon]